MVDDEGSIIYLALLSGLPAMVGAFGSGSRRARRHSEEDEGSGSARGRGDAAVLRVPGLAGTARDARGAPSLPPRHPGSEQPAAEQPAAEQPSSCRGSRARGAPAGGMPPPPPIPVIGGLDGATAIIQRAIYESGGSVGSSASWADSDHGGGSGGGGGVDSVYEQTVRGSRPASRPSPKPLLPPPSLFDFFKPADSSEGNPLLDALGRLIPGLPAKTGRAFPQYIFSAGTLNPVSAPGGSEGPDIIGRESGWSNSWLFALHDLGDP